jgi:hypothetical protein
MTEHYYRLDRKTLSQFHGVRHRRLARERQGEAGVVHHQTAGLWNNSITDENVRSEVR